MRGLAEKFSTQITFHYFNWVLNFSASPRIQKQYRRDGARYRVSPWALTWDNENYYLIAFDHDAGEIRHYRVDKMDSLVQTDLPREGKQLFDDRFDAAAYSRKVFGMFSGEEKTVKLKCLNRFIGVMLDRFGSSLRLFPKRSSIFIWMWMLSSVHSFFPGCSVWKAMYAL